MPPNRVVLTGLPTMLRDVVRTVIAQDPTLAYVRVSEAADLPAAVATGADVVVYGTDAVPEHQAAELLSRHCSVRLVGIAADGGIVTVVEMRPHTEVLEAIGVGALARVLRGTGAVH